MEIVPFGDLEAGRTGCLALCPQMSVIVQGSITVNGMHDACEDQGR